MTRKQFLKQMSAVPLAGVSLSLSALERAVGEFPETPVMPVLFLGHGSPMNAIEENEFVAGFRQTAKSIPRPSAILCIF